MTRLITLDQWDADAALRMEFGGGCVSIGNFDGVHLGHRRLLEQTRRCADEVGGAAITVVLDPHPAAVLRPHGAPPRLTTIERRAELMSALSVDALLVCPTTIDFLNRTAKQFFEQLIRDRLAARAMVEGPNFFFGRDRGGDIHRLQSLCDADGMKLTIVQPALDGPRMISSSRIREAVSTGDFAEAHAMLGSHYQISGLVGHGEGRGRTIGFPTANLTSVTTMSPGHGVYAAVAFDGAAREDGSPRAAAVHVGPNPTFDEQTATKIEVHLLDYAGDLYGQTLTIAFIEKVRDVRRFKSAAELVDQLDVDLIAVRRSFETFTPSS